MFNHLVIGIGHKILAGRKRVFDEKCENQQYRGSLHFELCFFRRRSTSAGYLLLLCSGGRPTKTAIGH